MFIPSNLSRLFSAAGAYFTKVPTAPVEKELTPEELERKKRLSQHLRSEDTKTATRILQAIPKDTFEQLVVQHDYKNALSMNAAWVTRFVNICTGILDQSFLQSGVRYTENDPFEYCERICIWVGFLLPIHIKNYALNVKESAEMLVAHTHLMKQSGSCTDAQINLIQDILAGWDCVTDITNKGAHSELILNTIHDAMILASRKPQDPRPKTKTLFGSNDAFAALCVKHVSRDTPSNWAFIYQNMMNLSSFATLPRELVNRNDEGF